MKRAWTLMMVGGFLLIIASLFADTLGLGNSPVFGWRQIAGVILGLLLILAAPYMKRRRQRLEDRENPEPTT